MPCKEAGRVEASGSRSVASIYFGRNDFMVELRELNMDKVAFREVPLSESQGSSASCQLPPVKMTSFIIGCWIA
jgi:hypothetical protein